jgi:ketosteroid isomerase-like protein
MVKPATLEVAGFLLFQPRRRSVSGRGGSHAGAAMRGGRARDGLQWSEVRLVASARDKEIPIHECRSPITKEGHMKKAWVSLAVAVLATGLFGLVGCSTRPKATPEAFEKAVNAIWEKYSATLLAGDINGWIALWDEGGVQLPPNAPMNVGIPAIKKSMMATFAAVKFEKFAIAISGTFVDHKYGFVYGNYTYTLAPKAGGVKILGDGKYETILKRQPDGSWRIFRDCFNSNLAP